MRSPFPAPTCGSSASPRRTGSGAWALRSPPPAMSAQRASGRRNARAACSHGPDDARATGRHVGAMDLVIQAPALGAAELTQIAALSGSQAVRTIGGGSAPAYRLARIESRAGVADFCTTARIDCAFVPPDLIRDRVGVVAMDMDSTLITIECIDEIADLAGIKPAVAAITAAAMRGDIDFRDSLERRVALLAGLPEEALPARLRRAATALARRAAADRRVQGGRREDPARLGRLHLLHRAAACAPRARRNDREHARSRRRRQAHRAHRGIDRRRAREGGAVLRAARRDARPPAGSPSRSATAPTTCRCFAPPTSPSPITRSRSCAPQATYAIDFCGLDAVLNLFA